MPGNTPDPSKLTDPTAHSAGAVHPIWTWMRRNSPVHWHEEGLYPGFWSVVRYQDVRRVYLEDASFSSTGGVMLRRIACGDDPGGNLALALTDPPRHSEIRALLADSFSARTVALLESGARQATRSVLERVADAQICDFLHDVTARLTIALVARLFGIPDSDQDLLFGWIGHSFSTGAPLASNHSFMRYLVDLISEQARHPGGGLLDVLAGARFGGSPVTDVELLLNCENIIGAAENSGLSMAQGLIAFADHPEQWSRLRQHRELVPSAVNEVLRWTSSATHSMRTATQDVCLGNKRIARGDRVVLWLPSANRDERAFHTPNKFDIGRRPNRHVALGAGVHACIGGSLARMQSRVFLEEMLDSRFYFELVSPGSRMKSIVVSGPERLPVRVVRGGATQGGQIAPHDDTDPGS